MKREKITISENGIITLPGNPTETVWMRAELFGVMIPTIKSNIRIILKSRVVKPDHTHGGTVIGNAILADYFGLDMVVALAFRINSLNSKLFREYILSKLYIVNTQSIFIQVNADKRSNKEKVIFN